jgi:PAS domain S-box-containing protein
MTELVDILIVEDEAIFALDLEGMVQGLGHRVVGVADSATRAVALAREKRPGLVLMDVRLRGADDGVEVGREIGLRFETPVVFLTGNSDAATMERAATANPFGFLVKPVDQRSLAAAIETALARWRTYRGNLRLQNLLLATFQSLPDGVMVVDADKRIAFVNLAAERLLGLYAAEAIGREFQDIIRRADSGKACCAEQLAAVLAGGPTATSPAASLVRRDGMHLPVHATLSPLVSDGAVSGAVFVLRPVERS